MKTITIEWQLLVREGQTCDRCTDTGRATEAAVEKLRNCLSQIGVDVRLETKSLDPSTFEKAPVGNGMDAMAYGRLSPATIRAGMTGPATSWTE